MNAYSRNIGIRLAQWLLPVLLALVSSKGAAQSEYYYDSYQLSDQHRYEEGAMGGFWGHHLGHMVRTASFGLWYIDDTGRNVNRNPAIAYYRFEGNRWVLVRTLVNPNTIQQNTATLAVGDTIYSYGLNISGGYIEEAVCDPRTGNAWYNRKIKSTGPGTNYIGAAVSPVGTRVVWWTMPLNPYGPSTWSYMYNAGGGWSDTITSTIEGADFSYVFASFLNDSTFYVGGEVPRGPAPWTFEAAAGKVVLGNAVAEFTKMKGDGTANDIWVNLANGDVHLLVYGSFGGFGYFYKPAGGNWSDSVSLAPNLSGVTRARWIDPDDGNLYLITLGGGTKMMVIPKSEITGKIDFTGRPLVSLGSMEDYVSSWAIWPESPQFQTTPVTGINFVCPGNDYTYSTFTRHTSVALNPGTVDLRISMPNGLEVLEGNKNKWIYWYHRPSAGIDTVSIDFSTDSGVHWTVAAPGVRNTGSLLWKVPAVAGTNCRIRVRASAGSGASDTSDADFAIAYTPVILKTPVGSIANPTTDTTVRSGSAMTFEATAADTDGYIVNYLWRTGDGRTVKGLTRKFTHTYTAPGAYDATLQVQDNDTLWSLPDTVRIKVQGSSEIKEQGEIPRNLELLPCYPNPFNAGTVISYSLDRTMMVRLSIFSILGAEVTRLVDQVQPAGPYQVAWDAKMANGRASSSGWYICRLETPAGLRMQKILLIK